jgi:eukaryotic-like serine/threonine-protein kinase
LALTPGTRLGPYEVITPIGEGGMGQVYRARDTRLNRDVALKVLPDSFANDPDRLARFQREAQVLASLNHPHIAHLYGLERQERREGQDGRSAPFLVMELVEGEDLAQRLTRGAIPTDEALPIAKQIAEALEAAHEQGIIHRDLKPANIKVRADGTVKVLDFGLAKAMDPPTASPDVSRSPTITTPAMTHAGMILGTAAYMAPEQARGKAVDKRADIWAFGCVLFEMLSGTKPFAGDEVTDTLAFIITREPDWNVLPRGLPTPIQRLLRRCLQKNPNDRLHDIGDARLEISDAATGTGMAATPDPTSPLVRRNAPRWKSVVASALAMTALVGATAAGTAWWLWPEAKIVRPVRFTVTPTGKLPLPFAAGSPYRDFVISPDGSRIVYNVAVSADNVELWVRSLDALEGTQIPGIIGRSLGWPFMSPDGNWIAFFWGGELKKVLATGGAAITVCRVPGGSAGLRGGSWGPDNTIIFASDGASGLMSVPAGGGEPTILTTPDREHGEIDHVFPVLLLDGHSVLFTIVRNGDAPSQIALLDIRTGDRRILLTGGSQPEYIETGKRVYVSNGSLRVVPFDLAKREVTGDSLPVIDSVMTKANAYGAAEFSVSRSGTLVYQPGSPLALAERSLVWVARDGREEPLKAPARAYESPRISPDGKKIAVSIRDQANDIWLWDTERTTLRRLTDDPATDIAPVWTSDGQRIIFSSGSAGALNLYWKSADGSGSTERLTTSDDAQTSTSVSPDGTAVLAHTPGSSASKSGILRVQLGPTPRTEYLLASTSTVRNPMVSPDGKWLAYSSDESGPSQIYVRPFPKVNDGWWQVSNSGGTKPLWSRNGRELFYLDTDRYLTSVPIDSGPTFSSRTPIRILQSQYYSGANVINYDVAPDGQRFVMIKNPDFSASQAAAASLVVVLNWAEGLKALVPTKSQRR